MFENSGERIKSVAKVVFVVNVIIIWVMLIGVLIVAFNMHDGDGELVVIFSFLVAVIALIVAWVTSLFMVAFGDLVKSNKETMRSIKLIVELLAKKQSKYIVNNENKNDNNKDNKDDMNDRENKDIVEYTVVFSNGSECKVQTSKKSGWNDIRNACLTQNGIDKEIKYIIDEKGMIHSIH